MRYWIFGDSLVLSERIRSSLLQLHLHCPESQLLTLAVASQSPLSEEMTGDIIFIAIPTIDVAEIEVIRHIRAATKGQLVVVSAATDNATIVNAMRAGVTDFLSDGYNLTEDIASCLSRLEHVCAQ